MKAGQKLITDNATALIDETASGALDKTKGLGKITFSTQPIKPFGILFDHPYPLDLSIIKYCFMGCSFCFATANKRSNKDVVGNIMDPTNLVIKKIQKANGQGYNSESFIEFCIHNKYPIVFSNNVDPFLPASEVDYKLGERVLRACLEYRQPLQIQTKEVYPNDVVRDLLIEGKDLFNLYVSISTLDLETARRYETAAVTPQERLDRMKYLSDRGVKVCMALNPYVPEWQPDLRAYFKAAKDCGSVGVYTDPLHLTANQKKVMPKKMAEFAGVKNNLWDRFFGEDVHLMQQLADEVGIKLYYQMKIPCDYYKGNSAKLKAWPFDAFKLIQHVHDVYAENGEDSPVLITWKLVDEFYSNFEGWDNIFKIEDFAGLLWYSNIDRERALSTLGKRNRLKNIYRFVYNNPEVARIYRNSFIDYWCMRLVDSEGLPDGEYSEIADDNGDIMYIYDPRWPEDSVEIVDQADEDLPELIEMEGFEP